MNRKEKRDKIKQSLIDNAKFPDKLEEVLKEGWPPWPFKSPPPDKVFRSKTFMVQQFNENGEIRLSVCRTEVKDIVNNKAVWKEDIKWEELQELKRQAGYGDHSAVEMYPKDKDVVNVANMRHLWIVEGLRVGWEA